jgi:DNA-directed RNA polymerase beta subunit
MEIDALKAHGAGGMVLERTSRVSDHKMLLKCPDVGSLVSFNQATGTYTCVETGQMMNPEDVVEHDTVWSWHLWEQYCRSICINIQEEFQ